MYQYSLTWFQSMFSSCIQESASVSGSVHVDNISQSNVSIAGSIHSTARDIAAAAPEVVEEEDEEEPDMEDEEKEESDAVEDSDENPGLFSPASSHKFASGVLRPSSVKSIKSMRSNQALSTGGKLVSYFSSFCHEYSMNLVVSFLYL